MNINATIVIQAFNFFIVYWMLKSFLFKPVIAIIEHNDAEEKSLIDVIDQQQRSLAIQEKERQKQWFLCQEYFASHKPSLLASSSLTTPAENKSSVVIHSPSSEEMTSLVVEVRTALEEKIKHVH